MDVRLVMFREDGTRKAFPLSPGSTTIGRKEDCSIRIPLIEVSRRHAEIFIDEDGAVLRDLGASNGTHLNNQRITEEDLEPGDHVIIGPVIFTVQIDGEPTDDEIIQIRTKLSAPHEASDSNTKVGTSEHVYMSHEEADPIAELEALASSAEQTAINPEDDEDEL